MSKSVRIPNRSYERADELRQHGFESLTNVMAVAIDRLYQAERPKEEPMTVYIARDADYWGAEPTDAEIATLVEHTEQVAEEWTSRPVEVRVVNETFSAGTRNEPLADEIAEAAWNRMFS
jgi:hypothetical protein